MSVWLLLYGMIGAGVVAAVAIERDRKGERIGLLCYVMGLTWPAALGVLLIFSINALDDAARQRWLTKGNE